MPEITLSPRKYQKSIVETAKNYNTLVILPTGLGKTAISVMISLERLTKFPDSKALILAPTKPLASQHELSFKTQTNLSEEKIALVTGVISPKKREKIYKEAKVIIATPQTIQSDLKNNRISLENISTLTIDECHKSKERYATTIVSKKFMKESNYPRIIALTASPGSTREKINQIKENLFIEKIEIRDEESEDVSPYIQKKKIEHIELDLPQGFKNIHKLISEVYKKRVQQIKDFGLTKPISVVNKRDLITFQSYLFAEAKRGNRAAYYGVSLTAQAIKLSHALELLETQGLTSMSKFLEKIEKETSKASKNINKEKNIIKARELIEKLIQKNKDHPKLDKLIEIIKKEFSQNKSTKVIIFANFRETVKNIVKELKKIPKASPVELIGQKEGITQKKQLETLKQFEEGKYNILVGTQIIEEGLDIKGNASLSTAIFYDAVPSSIRRVQRSGRVGRLKPGKIIHLITKNTRDQGYFWKSYKDEKKMKSLISKMQSKLKTTYVE